MEAIIQMLKHIIYTMVLILALAVLATAFGCGRHERSPHEPEKQSECTVIKADNQTTISCPDGSTASINDGVAGESGGQGPQGLPGMPGEKGPRGIAGSPGAAGTNGQDATQIRPVLPCPALISPYPEELFCISDTLYAVYDANSSQVHLSSIPPGNYVTTDGRACHFTVIAGCEIQ